MITIPENAYTYRMLTIDNGSTTLGLSIVDLDLREKTLKVIYSETCDANKTVKRYGYIAENHGDRFARFRVLREFVNDKLEHFDPDVVVIETPFMHRHPSAYATLREAMYMVIDTCTEYDYRLEVQGVTPMEAKKAVGATRYDKGKDPIRTAVLALNDVYYVTGIDPKLLDEHCIDSIAVAYCKSQEVLKSIYKE
jgi:Holliday junction resolvasome RuvABC endonuclease subunit